ncbi:hypothetical protein HOB87_01190 [Candidatus Woesearchaeota archaeon]|jgi:hypothetical protein|nr:hypothetical protein [Candidatus Woesearchaeota archaeon]MBT3438684.1 hypothetical protein [Candidatus Woesearchaeota archaeon]MBT4058109.1 hypothetical protein [Candidatus Woesearchaeota archaeon]MBT4730572.1 hypothetical protein [Candidatus Woesearchaeota archaeon]MBT4783473.1 hypothetical protein [Candidatus Woesearchaeota archaeon]
MIITERGNTVAMPDYNPTDQTHIVADLNSRVRSLENKYNTLTERLLVINQNMIHEYKKLMEGMRNISKDSKITRMNVSSTQEAVRNVVKELSIFAKKDQIKMLEKYIDMINILKLVTDEQLEERLESFKLDLNKPKTERGVKVARK